MAAAPWHLLATLLCMVVMCCPLGRAAKTTFSAAWALNADLSDFGWNYGHNVGRMYMNAQLTALYPNMTISSTFRDNVPDTAGYVPPNCPPIFEQWAREGYDLIVASSFGYQWCAKSLAAQYPDTVFLGINQALAPSKNYALGNTRLYQPAYLAGIIAGHMTKTGIVCTSQPGPWGDAVGHFSAFALGVARANASLPVHVGWSGGWAAPQQNILIARYMYSIGCDVIWSRSNGMEGLQQANALGMLGIGFVGDFQLLIGESVLTSPTYVWGPMYLEVARMIIEGTYAASAPVDLFPGYESDAVALTELSYLVPAAVAAEVADVTIAMRNGTFDVFCGAIATNDGTTVGSPGTCITGYGPELITWYPANVIDCGTFLVPSQVCSPGEEAIYTEGNHSYLCRPCPGGTYSVTTDTTDTENMTCVPCPSGEHSAPNATGCALCPAGTTITALQDACLPIPPSNTVWIVAVVCIMVVLVFGGIAGAAGWRVWRATADLRALKRQFSNDNVAQQCAEAIARLDLDAVAWLRTIPAPNKIQSSFLQILNILTEVRPYIPDQLLTGLLGHSDQSEEVIDASAIQMVAPVPGKGAAAYDKASRDTMSGSESDSQGNNPAKQRRLQALESGDRHRRCLYLHAQLSTDDAGEAGGVTEGLDFAIAEIIAIAKQHGATIDYVTQDTLTFHWGLASACAESALRATQAALDVAGQQSRILVSAPRGTGLQIALTFGLCSVSTIKAAQHRFFVLRGRPVREAMGIIRTDLCRKVTCQVLISPAVYEQVKYRVQCMPRCLMEGSLLWQPMALRDATKEDEWMYQLKDMDAQGDEEQWSHRRLQALFQLAATGRTEAIVHAEAAALRQRFGVRMTAADITCVDHLLAGYRPPGSGPSSTARTAVTVSCDL